MFVKFKLYITGENFEKYIFAICILLKILAYSYYIDSGWRVWASASDADYYDKIAKGTVSVNNYWGNFLLFLNINGLYSRSLLTHVIFLCNCLVIPYVFVKIYTLPNRVISKEDWRVLLLLALYPTLNVFSLDIFRDVPMILLFLWILYAVRSLMSATTGELINIRNIFHIFTAMVAVYVLHKLRFYLASALIIAFVAAYFFDFSKSMWRLAALYLVVLQVADLMGVFDWMKIEYRNTYLIAKSVYGIDFSNGLFLLNFLKSFLANIYGFHIYDKLSLIVFAAESVPAILLSLYVLANRQYVSRFIIFLIYFFFLYSGIWVIGVDALGTGVRYRIFSYLAIFLAAILVRQKVFEANVKIDSNFFEIFMSRKSLS